MARISIPIKFSNCELKIIHLPTPSSQRRQRKLPISKFAIQRRELSLPEDVTCPDLLSLSGVKTLSPGLKEVSEPTVLTKYKRNRAYES